MANSNESPNRKTENISEDYTETLEVTYSESRSILDHHVGQVDYVNNKAARVIELNALILGVIISVSTFLAQAQFEGVYTDLFGIPLWAAFFATAGSILFAYWAIHPRAYIGIDPENISFIKETKPSKERTLELILESHENLALENIHQARRAFNLLKTAYVLLFIDIGLYGLTFYNAATDPSWERNLLILIVVGIAVVLGILAAYPTYIWKKKFVEIE